MVLVLEFCVQLGGLFGPIHCISNWPVLTQLWEESLEIAKDSEIVARIRGVPSQMHCFTFLFGVNLGELILRHTDNLSRTLQHKELSASESQEIARLTVATLQTLRNDESYELFWKQLEIERSSFEVGEPTVPRKRKVPRRIDDGAPVGDHYDSPKDRYRVHYFEALDLATNCIKSRFDQMGYNTYKNLQELLLKAIRGEDFEAELNFVCDFYGDDFSKFILRCQLQIVAVDYPPEDMPHSLSSIKEYVKSLSSAKKLLISEVYRVATLILVMPVTNATMQ